MPVVLGGTSSPSVDSSFHSPHPLPPSTSTVYQSASVLFILIGVLFAILLCYRFVNHVPLPASVSPSKPTHEMQYMETKRLTSETPPANAEALRDDLSFPDLSDLPHPTVRQYQGPFLNDPGSSQGTIKTNTSQLNPANTRTVTRREMIQNTNGCRRHVMTWG